MSFQVTLGSQTNRLKLNIEAYNEIVKREKQGAPVQEQKHQALERVKIALCDVIYLGGKSDLFIRGGYIFRQTDCLEDLNATPDTIPFQCTTFEQIEYLAIVFSHLYNYQEPKLYLFDTQDQICAITLIQIEKGRKINRSDIFSQSGYLQSNRLESLLLDRCRIGVAYYSDFEMTARRNLDYSQLDHSSQENFDASLDKALAEFIQTYTRKVHYEDYNWSYITDQQFNSLVNQIAL